MKRAIFIRLKDNGFIPLEISKATTVKSSKDFIHLDKLNDGTWRLIWSENLIPDFSTVTSFDVIREG